MVKKRKGFSLIELLIVIAIIGIIATIAIPLLLSARDAAIDEKCRNSVRSVVSAEAAYYAAQGAYGAGSDLYNGGVAPTYIDERFNAASGVPVDLGNDITLTLTTDGVSFTVTATGKNNQYDADESGNITETAL